MITAGYALMHFFVDFICAWAVFHAFRDGPGGYWNLLVYNFCAFALQMPLGALLDLARGSVVEGKRRWLAFVWSCLGTALTLVGALLHPAVLGTGNALFHVGGGMDVIQEDFRRNRKGSALGLFVAPGALGLYLGTWLGKSGTGMILLVIPALLLAALLIVIFRNKRVVLEPAAIPAKPGTKIPALVLCCFLVVVLRSWVGLAVTFPWKEQPLLGLLSVVCVAGGKVLGGVASARWGIERTVKWSLLLASCCYLLGEIPGFGLGALVLFNMSMPVTLYLLAVNLPGLYGFSFGLLTFGLFLGFLPVYAGLELPVSGRLLGMAGSLASLVLLTAAGKAADNDRICV